jgi:hypothetical protein
MKDEEERLKNIKVVRGIYHGESSRTAYSRISEHFSDYTKKNKKKEIPEELWMLKHMIEDHDDVRRERRERGEEEGNRYDFTFGITGTFCKPTTRILNESSRVRLEELGDISTGAGKAKAKILNTKNLFHLPKDVQIVFSQL